MATKITPRKKEDRETVLVKTKADSAATKPGDWWNAASKREMADKLVATAVFLKTENEYRYRQASLYARLYGNMPFVGGAGANLTKITTRAPYPTNRPTMSVITSITDTIISRMMATKPRPVFLTDNADYKQRTLAKEMNTFIGGELYQTKYYQFRQMMLRDACVWGTGVVKVLEDQKKRVALERRLATQLMVDSNEAFLSSPRQLYEFQLIDRSVLQSMFPDSANLIGRAEQAFPEQGDSQKTVSDLVMVVEAWRLPSGPDQKDGLHAIACSAGGIDDEGYTKENFPFLFAHYSQPQVGFWGSGVSERQFGNQNAINQLLMTIHSSINLVGVPRVFVEKGSKVVKAHLNNQVGSIVEYSGTMPKYEVAPCVPVELYQEVQNVINRAYQEEGVSQLAANSVKPAGLNSGEALRQYDDVQQDRLSTFAKMDEQLVIDAAYLIIDKARDICERDGKYQTVYPDKDGTRQIDLPAAKLLENPFVIQCYEASSLPREPAGRLARVQEMMQAGLISPQEGRRLLDFPDISQEDKLTNAAEERILKYLDEIVESNKFTPPDPFMDLDLAQKFVVQYYNLYAGAKLEEAKTESLRRFFSQIQVLKAQAMTPPPMDQPVVTPQAAPQPTPTNEMIPNVPGIPEQ